MAMTRRRSLWGLPKPPAGANWPRLMTARHPRATGTYGPQMIAWAEERRLHPKVSHGTRWWQQLAAYRALEHDKNGRLVWPMVIISGPRQTGKSWLERMTCSWRIHQADLFGEEQGLLHVAHKLVAAQEVWRPAARWATGQPGANVRWANGEQAIELADGSRWMIQAATDGAGVAFSLSMALIDEGWRVRRQVFDEAIEPTLAEAESPQAWLISTAGTSESDLMMTNRAAALATLDDPEDVLLLEWSAPPDPELDIDDQRVWRWSQPHWDERRRDAMRRARAKGTERAFRQQWLNMWVPGMSGPLMGEDVWKRVVTASAPSYSFVCFGAEVAADRTAACIVATDGEVAELVEYREGAAWVGPRLRELAARHEAAAVAVHGTGPASAIADECEADMGEVLVKLNGTEMAAASGKLFDTLTTVPPGLRLRNHPHLENAVTIAERRPGSGGWAWSRDSAGMVLSAVSASVWAREHALTEEPMVFA